MNAAELIVDARNEVGESPVWHAREQALYWVDIPAKTLYRWTDGQLLRWTASQMIGCIAPHADGGWIAGLETGIFHLALLPGGVVRESMLVRLAHPREHMRSNDGRCDRQGRFWVGTMYMNMADSQQEGGLLCFAKPSRSDAAPLVQWVRGMYTPNGLAFSPDGRTLYQSDSHPQSQMIWAWDFDVDTGVPSNRRVFVDMNAMPGRPDGAAVDAEGCYWICGNDAGRLYRFTPEGKLDRQVELPVKKPSMCAFGGTDMKTLYVTSIRPAGVDLADQPLAGGVFALRPGVSGLPEPFFQP
jgi:sugar lactone lactonase YvrE